jgi:hypothetical protein
MAQDRHQGHAQAGADEAADDVVVVAPIADPRLETCLGADPLEARGALGALTRGDPDLVREPVDPYLLRPGQRVSGRQGQDQAAIPAVPAVRP